MGTIANCVGVVSIYYNLLIGLILAACFLWLFYIAKKDFYIKPWKVLFLAGIFYMIEEIFIVLRTHNIIYTPVYLDGFFGIIIVSLFIYMLLLQKEYVKGLKIK